MRASKTGVTQKRSASGEHLFVCRLDVRVCANDGADPAVEHSSQRNLLRSRLGVKVHQDDRSLRAQPRHFGWGRSEGVVQLGHENAPLKIQNSERRLSIDAEHATSLTG